MSSTSWWRKSVSSTESACTPDDLIEILVKPSNGCYVLPTDPYNEVFPRLYIGDG